MKPHRVYTLFRNLALALVAVVVQFAVVAIAPSDSWKFLLIKVIACQPLIAAVLALARPYRGPDPIRPWRKWIVGLLSVLSLPMLAGSVVFVADAVGLMGWVLDLQFRAKVSSADRVVIRDGGFCHGDPDREPSLYVITNKAEIVEFRKMFSFSGFRARCMCCGYPSVDWWKDDRRIVRSAIHHGLALRCTGFPGDIGLTSASRLQLVDWFDRHCDLDLAESGGPRYRLCALVRSRLEGLAHDWIKEHPGERPALEDVRKLAEPGKERDLHCPCGGVVTLSFGSDETPTVRCDFVGHQ